MSWPLPTPLRRFRANKGAPLPRDEDAEFSLIRASVTFVSEPLLGPKSHGEERRVAERNKASRLGFFKPMTPRVAA